MQHAKQSPFPLLMLSLLLVLVLVGCASSATPPITEVQPTTAAPATIAATVPTAVEPTVATSPTISATTESTAPTEPAATLAPEASATSASMTDTEPPTDQPYLDDRSTPQLLMASFINAINSRHYLRAYSYWDAERAEALPSFEEFEAGYADTESVEMTMGEMSGDDFYYQIPVRLEAQLTSGETKNYFGCYLLYFANPSEQATVPYHPLAIESATIVEAASSEEAIAQMEGSGCAEATYPDTVATVTLPTPDPADITEENYLDNRSNAVAVVQSLFNAINSRHYARAYSYWEVNAEGLPTFEEFQASFAETQQVELFHTGEVRTDAGAGQQYFAVPYIITVDNTNGSGAAFAGCYLMHLANPAIQATPPFQPLGISAAVITQMGEGDDSFTISEQLCDELLAQ